MSKQSHAFNVSIALQSVEKWVFILSLQVHHVAASRVGMKGATSQDDIFGKAGGQRVHAINKKGRRLLVDGIAV